MIDFIWGVWSGLFDEAIKELCTQDMQAAGAKAFFWHRYLHDSTNEIGIKYRAFVASCQ